MLASALSDRRRRSQNDHLTEAIEGIVAMLDQRVSDATAAWMAGMGRVTANLTTSANQSRCRRVVVVTPLYIEYVDEPSVHTP